MIQPRNDWVVLRLIEKATQKHGSLVIPETKSQYCEAEVVAVGPGNVAAAGGRADTYDLKAGQLVFVQHKKPVNAAGLLVYSGVPYRKDGKTYFIFDQSSVVGILAETCDGVGEEYVEIGGPQIATPSKQLVH